MKKLRLDLENLKVDSFNTTRACTACGGTARTQNCRGTNWGCTGCNEVC